MLNTTGRKVIVEVFDKRNQTRSGIILPVTVNNAFVPHAGIVVSVGEKVREKEIEINKKVFVEKYVGDKVEYEGRLFLVLTESNILSILPDDYDVAVYEEDKNHL